MSISKHSGPGLPTLWEQPLEPSYEKYRYLTKEECGQRAPFGTATYPRTRRSWLADAQSFIDFLIVLLLASVFLNVYLAIRLMEASR